MNLGASGPHQVHAQTYRHVHYVAVKRQVVLRIANGYHEVLDLLQKVVKGAKDQYDTSSPEF